MVVASKAGIRVLCMVANGSCCNLRSADVSRVVTVAIFEAIDPTYRRYPCYRIRLLSKNLLTMYIRCLCIRQPPHLNSTSGNFQAILVITSANNSDIAGAGWPCWLATMNARSSAVKVCSLFD